MKFKVSTDMPEADLAPESPMKASHGSMVFSFVSKKVPENFSVDFEPDATEEDKRAASKIGKSLIGKVIKEANVCLNGKVFTLFFEDGSSANFEWAENRKIDFNSFENPRGKKKLYKKEKVNDRSVLVAYES